MPQRQTSFATGTPLESRFGALMPHFVLLLISDKKKFCIGCICILFIKEVGYFLQFLC